MSCGTYGYGYDKDSLTVFILMLWCRQSCWKESINNHDNSYENLTKQRHVIWFDKHNLELWGVGDTTEHTVLKERIRCHKLETFYMKIHQLNTKASTAKGNTW